jgi:integrase
LIVIASDPLLITVRTKVSARRCSVCGCVSFVPEVTTHSFRKTVATLIDDDGLSARIWADHLGHSHVSMTQGRNMSRGRIHTR